MHLRSMSPIKAGSGEIPDFILRSLSWISTYANVHRPYCQNVRGRLPEWYSLAHFLCLTYLTLKYDPGMLKKCNADIMSSQFQGCLDFLYSEAYFNAFCIQKVYLTVV